MSKKTHWWRRPRDDDDEYYDDDEEFDEDDRKSKKEKSKKFKHRTYGNRYDDWHSPHDRFFRSPFGIRDDLFLDIEHEFGEMQKRMNRMFHEAMEGKLEQPGKGGPFVYGFSMRTGPDGIPHVQEFGNMPPEMRNQFSLPRRLPLTSTGELESACNTGTCSSEPESREYSSRKPLTDIMECDDHLTITMELPGIEKNDINLEIIENELEVNVDTPVRKYYNKLPLPSKVDPNSIRANFKNGVLDVNLKLLEPKPKKGKRIEIN